MKLSCILIISLLLGVTPPPSGTTSMMTSDGKQPQTITNMEVDSVSYLVGYSFGMQLMQKDFGPLDCSQIIRGIQAAYGGVEIDYELFQQSITSFLERRRDAVAAEMRQRSNEMLSANAQREGVVTTVSGLQYKIIRLGSEVKPTEKDIVIANYEGKNLDGKVFDSSYERGAAAKFPLDGVIKGWMEGLQLIGEGGEIMLWIPAELAYGERGVSGDIRPNEALSFKIELISVLP